MTAMSQEPRIILVDDNAVVRDMLVDRLSWLAERLRDANGRRIGSEVLAAMPAE